MSPRNLSALGRLRRLKETKMCQNRDLGLDPGLNSPENLMDISNPLTSRVKTFQLSLSVKSQLNVNSSSPERFDSKRKIFQDI